MNIKNVMYRYNIGCTQKEIVEELDLTEEDVKRMIYLMHSWFDILHLEARTYQRFVKRYY